MGLGIGSISSIAKKSLGSVSKVRTLLDFNPTSMGLVFPPQVTMGLELAKAVGIKVPTEKELLGLATGKIDKLLGGVRGDIKVGLDGLESLINGAPGKLRDLVPDSLKGLSQEEILQSISWLL